MEHEHAGPAHNACHALSHSSSIEAVQDNCRHHCNEMTELVMSPQMKLACNCLLNMRLCAAALGGVNTHFDSSLGHEAASSRQALQW